MIFTIIISVDVLSKYDPQNILIYGRNTLYRIERDGDFIKVNGKRMRLFSLKDDTYRLRLKDVERTYKGGFIVFSDGNVLKIINYVDEFTYLCSVVREEMTSDNIEALKAQTVVARTFLYRNLGRHEYSDMCDLTHCQVYKGIDSIPEVVKRAVRETEGLLILYRGEIAEVYYHSTCGGITADPSNVWGTDSFPPYLKSIKDPYCTDSPHYMWRYSLPLDSLRKMFKKKFKEIGYVKSDDSTTVYVIIDGDTLRGWDFRQVVCRNFGWNVIKSSFFSLTLREDSLIIEGHGLGHRVGLCQWGTIGMAERGFSFLEILRYYFPGTKVGVME